MIRIATVADTRFRQRAANLLRSLENSPNDFHLTVYCDDEAAFCGLRGLRCDVVELTEIKRLGAKRAKLTAFAEALRGGSVIYLDADAIVLENLDELWGGDRIKGVLDDLEEQRDYLTFIQDPKRPWPEDPSLLNRCYIASCAFYAPIGLFPLFEEMRLASLDDTTWRRYIAEGFLYDQQFLNAFLNKNEAPIELLDPTVYGWDGLLSRGAVQVYRSGRRLLNKHTHRTLRLALFAGPQQTPELLRSLPIEVASLIFERIAPDKPTWEGAMAQLYAALSDPLGKRSREPFVKDILKLMITEIPHLAANYASPDLANQPSYFANPDLIRSAAFANPLPQCTWNGLFCGGANLDPEEYCQVRTLVRRLNIRQVLEAGAGETSILFQALGAKTYSLEYQRGPWVDRATASGATCLLVPFDEERRRFSEPELRDRLAELGLSAVDLLFIDSPVGARNRHNVPSQLLEQVKPRFVLYHDSLRDSANLLQDQVRHDLKLIYFLDSPRGLALFALPPHETSGWLTDSFDAATVVSEGRVILAFLEPRAAVLQAGERSCVRIGLTNTTEDTLSSRYTQPIHLAYHWLAMDGTTVVWDGVRTGLPCDLDPGDTVECLLTVVAPEQEGIYRLQAAIVQEGVSWFEIAEPDSAAEAVVCVEAPPRRRGIRDSGWPGQERIHLRGRNADGSTLPGACFIRNPDLVEQPGIENGFSIPLRPRFMQLSSFAAGILDHFGDEPASLDETSADTTPAVREAVDALVELGALLRTEARCLITGCGRSGTKYIAHLLSAAGLDIGHETMGKDGIASWLMAVDSAYADRGPLRRHFRFRTILHQTRDPLASISSMQTMQLPSWRYICRHIPCSLEEPLLLRCAKYWRYWNLEAESIATWRYRVEDVACVWGELCERLEIAADRTVLSAVPQTTNTRQGNYQRLAWDDIASVDENLCTSIKEQAARYGYAVKN